MTKIGLSKNSNKAKVKSKHQSQDSKIEVNNSSNLRLVKTPGTVIQTDAIHEEGTFCNKEE